MGWGHVQLSRNCVILRCKVLLHLLSRGWGSFPAALRSFPFRAAAYGALFLAETQTGVLCTDRKAEGEMAEPDRAPVWDICILDLASCISGT